MNNLKLYQLGDLKRTNNNTINGALNNSGMGNNSSSAAEVFENSLLTLYETYHGTNEGQAEDVIAAEGILHLCEDLELPPDDFRILLFAWKCDAIQMGKLTKQEFIRVSSGTLSCNISILELNIVSLGMSIFGRRNGTRPQIKLGCTCKRSRK